MNKLKQIRLLHTVVWIFYNLVIFYIARSVWLNSFGYAFYFCMFMILLEVIILLAFRNVCPLTIMARKYSNSTAPNFDIYLPAWLAKYNKAIYSIILLLIITCYIIRHN